MAKVKMFHFTKKKQKKRKGIHSKNKSRTVGGSQYVKPYRGQGR
tara:strand:- start:1208 stop:1339 length:132 start_codon:yes stop_codon:yes gene_type:complete